MSADDLPIVLLKDQKIVAGQKLTGAFPVAFGAAAHAATIAPLDAETLLQHLHHKLHYAYKAERRMKTKLGRIANAFTGDDPDYIALSTHHLRQALALIEADAQGQLENGAEYLLRKDVARQAHDALGAQLGTAPEALREGLE